MRESEVIEFKAGLTDDINKEVVAFANANGGTIYIGIDDEGKEIGLQDISRTYERLTNIIRDTIIPDITMHIRYELTANDIIKINVAEGSAKPYYLKKNGLKPSGVYVRQGTSAVQASWNLIRQLIKIADGEEFEKARSIEQDLTFNNAQEEFKKRNIELSEDKSISLGIKDTEKKLFTNLALLISDQCPHSVKVAVFDDPANTIFIDRREFTGSIFQQLHETFAYLSLNNRTVSDIQGLDRIDIMDYPPEAIREALLNALVHRDYGYSGSIIINVNKEYMEFISLGGLMPGLSTNDIMIGISQPRNVMLAQIFYRLRHIEAYGTGIRRIFELYRDSESKPQITVAENTFRITLPNRNELGRIEKNKDWLILKESSRKTKKITPQIKKILNYLSQHSDINEMELMELIKVKKTRAYLVAREMAEMGLIVIVGRGRDKKFILRK